VVEKLPYFHVLSDVRGIIAEFVLEEGVGLGFLDEVDDALRVTILTGIMQGVFSSESFTFLSIGLLG
jgi:hypothetical protein